MAARVKSGAGSLSLYCTSNITAFNSYNGPIALGTLIVEDQGMFRAFLCDWFRGQEKFEVLGAAAAGRGYFSPRFCDAIRREGGKPLAVGKILSRREQQVLAHVLAGKTSREIGELIGLSARTVEFHRANLMAKLGSPSPTDLLIRAKQLGLG